MSPVIRILVLLCLAAIIMNTFHGFVNNLYSAKSYEANSDKFTLQAVSPESYESDTTYADIDLDVVAKSYPEVREGGWYVPSNVTTLHKHKVAIIVPYRDRQNHLKLFIKYMHWFLMKQQIEYRIFIIEQAGTRPFNRGQLMNVGFLESQKMGNWECFVFHDLDLLPLDRRNLYQCDKQPRHLAAAVDKFEFELPYPNSFGGVTAITLEQFKKVNGFANRYQGWGGEDDDMFHRLMMMGYRITRYNMSVARYTMLSHSDAPANPKRTYLLSARQRKHKKDGLSSLEYVVIMINLRPLYTHIIANLKETLDSIDLPFLANMLFGDKL